MLCGCLPWVTSLLYEWMYNVPVYHLIYSVLVRLDQLSEWTWTTAAIVRPILFHLIQQLGEPVGYHIISYTEFGWLCIAYLQTPRLRIGVIHNRVHTSPSLSEFLSYNTQNNAWPKLVAAYLTECRRWRRRPTFGPKELIYNETVLRHRRSC